MQRVTGMDQPDPSADPVAALYARTCPQLIGLLVTLGGSRADAEEVAHDAFVKLLGRWSTVREYDDPAAWVRTVAVRMLVSRRRRAEVARRGLRLLASGRSAGVPAASPDAVDVDRALAALPVHHRAVLVLHHAADLPVDQVADVLGVPVGTVKSRLARARAAITPLLGAPPGEDAASPPGGRNHHA